MRVYGLTVQQERTLRSMWADETKTRAQCSAALGLGLKGSSYHAARLDLGPKAVPPRARAPANLTPRQIKILTEGWADPTKSRQQISAEMGLKPRGAEYYAARMDLGPKERGDYVQTNRPPSEWSQPHMVPRLRHLMAHTALTMAEIAADLGVTKNSIVAKVGRLGIRRSGGKGSGNREQQKTSDTAPDSPTVVTVTGWADGQCAWVTDIPSTTYCSDKAVGAHRFCQHHHGVALRPPATNSRVDTWGSQAESYPEEPRQQEMD